MGFGKGYADSFIRSRALKNQEIARAQDMQMQRDRLNMSLQAMEYDRKISEENRRKGLEKEEFERKLKLDKLLLDRQKFEQGKKEFDTQERRYRDILKDKRETNKRKEAEDRRKAELDAKAKQQEADRLAKMKDLAGRMKYNPKTGKYEIEGENVAIPTGISTVGGIPIISSTGTLKGHDTTLSPAQAIDIEKGSKLSGLRGDLKNQAELKQKAHSEELEKMALSLANVMANRMENDPVKDMSVNKAIRKYNETASTSGSPTITGVDRDGNVRMSNNSIMSMNELSGMKNSSVDDKFKAYAGTADDLSFDAKKSYGAYTKARESEYMKLVDERLKDKKSFSMDDMNEDHSPFIDARSHVKNLMNEWNLDADDAAKLMEDMYDRMKKLHAIAKESAKEKRIGIKEYIDTERAKIWNETKSNAMDMSNLSRVFSPSKVLSEIRSIRRSPVKDGKSLAMADKYFADMNPHIEAGGGNLEASMNTLTDPASNIPINAKKALVNKLTYMASNTIDNPKLSENYLTAAKILSKSINRNMTYISNEELFETSVMGDKDAMNSALRSYSELNIEGKDKKMKSLFNIINSDGFIERGAKPENLNLIKKHYIKNRGVRSRAHELLEGRDFGSLAGNKEAEKAAVSVATGEMLKDLGELAKSLPSDGNKIMSPVVARDRYMRLISDFGDGSLEMGRKKIQILSRYVKGFDIKDFTGRSVKQELEMKSSGDVTYQWSRADSKVGAMANKLIDDVSEIPEALGDLFKFRSTKEARKRIFGK